ncbi:beta-galactosidase trimerization domain-containing protein [Botrimarina sp.]|uniref:beta-galactosidase trimerization domain-containing protein n=1 Tax=Botrimarina sp. TaxID=2795802 RepID=UPI0032EEC421
MHSVYDRLHDSPEQRYYRELAPMPLGSVYVQRPGDGEEQMRWHFRTMRELGYTALKQTLLCDGTDENRVAQIALDEGIWPWWYGEAGWERLTPDLLERLGLDPATSVQQARSDPRVVEHMTTLYRKRAERIGLESGAGDDPELTPLERYYYSKSIVRNLPDIARQAYADWAKQEYRTLEAVSRAHNRNHAGLGQVYGSWEEVAEAGLRPKNRGFARVRDEFRFRADGRLALLRSQIDRARAEDPLIPFRRGGEIALFLSMPLRGVDMEGIADLMKPGGCFYPSVHLEWHFNEVDHEITRPVYMHASWATDMFKGGWAFGVETTGGPQQHSGAGQAFTVDDGTMTQLMLSYLAGGFRGFGIWCWNARTAGLEAGEYALLGRNNEITPRARQVGRIGQAARKWRDELWAAHKEPIVGVFYDWDNEAIWAAMSNRGRDDFAYFATQARVGLSRALMNADVPFEYVTADDLRNGLAGRYRVIALPAVVALNEDLWPVFEEYVADGGRLVLDMPGGHMNHRAELLDTGRGSPFERLFGVVLASHQGAGVNRPWSIDGRQVEGWIADLTPTTAQSVTEFDHGAPAATEARHGDGRAVLLAWEAARNCFRPGDDQAERSLLRHVLGGHRSPHRCDGALLYRLASQAADHYFLINDGEAAEVALHAPDAYAGWTDAVTGDTIDDLGRVAIPRYSGRWLRAEKRPAGAASTQQARR